MLMRQRKAAAFSGWFFLIGIATFVFLISLMKKQEHSIFPNIELTASSPASPTTTVFQDFTTMTQLDPAIWNNTGKLPWGATKNQVTGEIQTYTKSAVSLSHDDGLCFTAQRKADGSWTSGAVDTQGKLFVGPNSVITIRYKLPVNNGKAPGFGPSIWMGVEPVNGQWIWPPEIDALEALGRDGLKIPRTVLHYDVDDKLIFNTQVYTGKLQGVYTNVGPDVSQSWNTLVIDRRNGQLIISHKGVITMKITNPGIVPKSTMFLLLNFPIAAGGAGWAGIPDSTTPNSGKFCISSVKVEKTN
jgi:hypothetical protein